MLVGDIMKKDIHTISPNTTVKEVVQQFVNKKVGTLPVIDEAGRFKGTVIMQRILNIFLPDFTGLLENISYLKDYGDLELNHELCNLEILDRAVEKVVKLEMTSLDTGCSLLCALERMKESNLTDLPVMDEKNHIVGLVSHVDIGSGILKILQYHSQESCNDA